MPERGFTIPADDVEAALGRGVMRGVLPEVPVEEPVPDETGAKSGPGEEVGDG